MPYEPLNCSRPPRCPGPFAWIVSALVIAFGVFTHSEEPRHTLTPACTTPVC